MAGGEDVPSAEQLTGDNSLVNDHEHDRSSIRSYGTQAGVRNIEAISQTWTKWSLIAAYAGYALSGLHQMFGIPSFLSLLHVRALPLNETDMISSIFLLAFATSLEGQTTVNLTVYATSAFSLHSLVSTVLVVQGVVNGKFPCRSFVFPVMKDGLTGG